MGTGHVVGGATEGVVINAAVSAAAREILTPEALAFVAGLHRRFDPRRRDLLRRRPERHRLLAAGQLDDLVSVPGAEQDADGDWRVAPAPADLTDRRVEITGPAERKMMINALNCGANVFMCDLEDALSPTWQNVTEGQVNLRDAVRRTISFTNPDGRQYALNETVATMVVRPRGWHLTERHVTVDGEPISASLFDAGLHLFHNGRELLDRGSGPYFYLPKLESAEEARLWDDVFTAAQAELGIPHGSIRATVLIETLPGALDMDGILYALRDHASGLNAGRWDYIFSAIKVFRDDPGAVLPDRSAVTMTVPFMRAYSRLLVRTCHRRGAHAIGGMAAFIPTRHDAAANEVAFARVREYKDREAGDGFDGTWVAHPGLVPVAAESFAAVLGDAPNQKGRPYDDIRVATRDLVDFQVPGGTITEAGLRANISVAIQYIDAWLQGTGAAAINNLMEDAATAEISRAQLWQWIRHGATTDDGDPITRERYLAARTDEMAKLAVSGATSERTGEAADILDDLVLSEAFEPFLTLPAYERLA